MVIWAAFVLVSSYANEEYIPYSGERETTYSTRVIKVIWYLEMQDQSMSNQGGLWLLCSLSASYSQPRSFCILDTWSRSSPGFLHFAHRTDQYTGEDSCSTRLWCSLHRTPSRTCSEIQLWCRQPCHRFLDCLTGQPLWLLIYFCLPSTAHSQHGSCTCRHE